MNDVLVTVVVPVYNVEKYLDRCIQSVLDQTHQNVELILIDDGSPDSSPLICDNWAKKDSRVRVIHKENEGQGIARNLGMGQARGRYICFLDSDDYLLPHTIETTLRQILREQAEVAVFGLACVDAQGNITESYAPQVGERTYRGEEVVRDFLPEFIAPDLRRNGQRLFYMSSCVLLYSMELIRRLNWSYVSERKIISEDVYSLLILFRGVNSVTIVPEVLYHYCHNEVSFSRKYTPNRYERVRAYYVATMALCKTCGYDSDISYRLTEPYISYTLGTLKQEAASGLPLRQRFTQIKKIIADDVLQQVLQLRKNDRNGMMRAVIFFCMRHRLYWVSFLLISMRA